MDESKTYQYTFGPEEKETLQKLSVVEASIVQNNQKTNQRELISTKYYSEFVVNTKNGPVTLNNIFITIERNKEGEISYHFRWIKQNENGEQSIEEKIAVDENGKVYTIEGLKDYLGDAEIDIEQLIGENEIEEGRLKGISEKAESKEVENTVIEKENKIKEATAETTQEQDKDENDQTQQIEQDLQSQGQDLRISKYRKIKDSNISERMPEVFSDGEESGIAFSNQLNRYVIISKVGDHYQINENVEPARMTWRTIISIGADGQKIERKVPHALMQLPDNDKKEIAVTLDYYGDADIETVDVLPCQERVSRSVEMENEGGPLDKHPEGEERPEVEKLFEQEGGVLLAHEIAHKQKILETEYGVTETDIEELKDLDLEAVIEEEADRVKMSKEGFKKYVKEADGKTFKEKISNAQEEIVQEYMGNRRPR